MRERKVTDGNNSPNMMKVKGRKGRKAKKSQAAGGEGEGVTTSVQYSSPRKWSSSTSQDTTDTAPKTEEEDNDKQQSSGVRFTISET